ISASIPAGAASELREAATATRMTYHEGPPPIHPFRRIRTKDRLNTENLCRSLDKSSGDHEDAEPVRGEQPGALGSLRESNREKVVKALQTLGVASRADIARWTGLSRSTVSSIARELHEEGLAVALADLSHQVLGEQRVEMADDYEAGEGMASAAELVERLLDDVGADRGR